MSSSPDILIVGGGPAGATLGRALARAGIAAALVDQARFPRRKACGGLLSPRSVALIAREFGRDRIAPLAATTGCRLYHNGEFVAEGRREREMYVVERSKLDARLLEDARRAGCDVIEGARVTEVEPEAPAARLEDGRRLTARLIVGADGVNSVVRRALWGAWPRCAPMGMGLVTDLPAGALRPEASDVMTQSMPRIYFGEAVWGYGWVFPKGECVSIGVGGLIGRNGDFRALLRGLVERCCAPGSFDAARVEGHRLPCGCLVRPAARGRALLIGDAAGLVEPVTGEGIAPAMESALLAAEAVGDALARGRPERAARAYQALLRQRMYPLMRQGLWARYLFFPRPCMRLAMRRLRRRPELVRMYLDLLAGETSYAGYFRRALFSRS